jgi:hypothetical protein
MLQTRPRLQVSAVRLKSARTYSKYRTDEARGYDGALSE